MSQSLKEALVRFFKSFRVTHNLLRSLIQRILMEPGALSAVFLLLQPHAYKP